MTAKAPPVPPSNRHPKDQGEAQSAEAQANSAPAAKPDPEKTGQQANTRINTAHQGHQQDR